MEVSSLPHAVEPLLNRLTSRLPIDRWGDSSAVSQLVEIILSEASLAGASDIHFCPAASHLEVAWRLDGVLHRAGTIPASVKSNVVTRLKVLAGLLTYHTDRPQEGRIHRELATSDPDKPEMRLSVVPTLFGEKAVVRLFGKRGRFDSVAALGLPVTAAELTRRTLRQTGGVLLITGPAGSGKTTTAYAAMRELAQPESQDGVTAADQTLRSLVSLEDPIESVLSQVAQSQVNRQVGFDYAVGLKSLLRQDPEVILVGEIRDAETAAMVFQAALTGHLVITTFHAGSAAQALSRLVEMELEPYQIRSGLAAVLNLRLLRGLCECGDWHDEDTQLDGVAISRRRTPVGCSSCAGTGYQGRIALAEAFRPADLDVGAGNLRIPVRDLEMAAIAAGLQPIRWQAAELIRDGKTSLEEALRVLGQ